MTDQPINDRTDYPAGVPCWIDTEQPDPGAAADFYGGVFGWEFDDKLPPGSEDRYLVARVNGFDVAAIASPTPGVPAVPARWNTYVRVDDVDATTSRAKSLGAEVLVAPVDAGPPGRVAGRWSALVDPSGAQLRLWQPGYRRGAQLVNAPGCWNSSDLTTDDAAGAASFYGALFDWEVDPVDFGAGDAEGDSYMWRRPGYGDFLAIRDPGIRERLDQPWVPAGFSDAIGWMTEVGEGTVAGPHWSITIGVEDTDAVTERAAKLGATVVAPPRDLGGGIVRLATLRDPQGAEFVVGSYDPSRLAA